jgi:hypothetical protein
METKQTMTAFGKFSNCYVYEYQIWREFLEIGSENDD